MEERKGHAELAGGCLGRRNGSHLRVALGRTLSRSRRSGQPAGRGGTQKNALCWVWVCFGMRQAGKQMGKGSWEASLSPSHVRPYCQSQVPICKPGTRQFVFVADGVVRS